MRYEHFDQLPGLLEGKLITKRKHPKLPLWIYNYTAGAQSLPIKEWPKALCDCRGLILDKQGEVIGRPFRKFWNYEQVAEQIPSHLPFTVWEKLDGSLGIVCNYHGRRIVATRGSFESEQAVFAEKWLEENHPNWLPAEWNTFLFEILFPENRIVVDYGETRELRLLAVMEASGEESLATFYAENRFSKAQSFAAHSIYAPGSKELNVIDIPGEEGYVVRWANGFRAKVKFEEYKRLHRLITQVSTRTIWEMLRAGEEDKLDECALRVPEDFRAWVLAQRAKLVGEFNRIYAIATADHYSICLQGPVTRKDFAELTKPKLFPSLIFALHDLKPITDMVWRLVEPVWATPFRREVEE